MTNSRIFGFGYDDYESSIYADPSMISSIDCIIPNPKLKKILGLEYTITNGVCHGVNVKTEKISPPVNATVYLDHDILDEIVLKNKFKTSKDPSESLIFLKTINNVTRFGIKLYVSEQYKRIQCIIGDSLGRYVSTFDCSYKLIYSGPALIVFRSKDVVQFLKYNRKILVYSPQELIRYAEKYNGDDTLTLENLEELETLLLSKDESLIRLGFLTLTSLNFIKYQESIKLMLNHICKPISFYTCNMPESGRYIFSHIFNWTGRISTVTFPHNYKINKDDWNLLKEYANYHRYTNYYLYFRFKCHFINEKGEVNIDEF